MHQDQNNIENQMKEKHVESICEECFECNKFERNERNKKELYKNRKYQYKKITENIKYTNEKYDNKRQGVKTSRNSRVKHRRGEDVCNDKITLIFPFINVLHNCPSLNSIFFLLVALPTLLQPCSAQSYSNGEYYYNIIIIIYYYYNYIKHL